jgi:hypothetical protein
MSTLFTSRQAVEETARPVGGPQGWYRCFYCGTNHADSQELLAWSAALYPNTDPKNATKICGDCIRMMIHNSALAWDAFRGSGRAFRWIVERFMDGIGTVAARARSRAAAHARAGANSNAPEVNHGA